MSPARAPSASSITDMEIRFENLQRKYLEASGWVKQDWVPGIKDKYMFALNTKHGCIVLCMEDAVKVQQNIDTYNLNDWRKL